MAIYILLSRLSQQGVATLKSNPDRLREVNHDVEELGARVLHQWATLGEYDFVNVVDAPDTATVARVSVALGARGSTKIQTLPVLTIRSGCAKCSGRSRPREALRLGARVAGGRPRRRRRGALRSPRPERRRQVDAREDRRRARAADERQRRGRRLACRLARCTRI